MYIPRPIRWAARPLLSAALLLSSCDRQPDPPSVPMPQGPIAYVGHGGVFDSAGQEIELTPDAIARIQAAYTDALLQRASGRQRRQFEGLRERVTGGQPLEGASRLVVNARLLDWLIATVRPAESERLSALNGQLSYRLRREYPTPRVPDSVRTLQGYDIPDELRRRLIDADLEVGTVTQGLSSNAAGEAYRTECRANGVPDPPDWGTAEWVARGTVSPTFIVRTLEARVFTFQRASPEGVCIALPRIDGNSIDALGIICLGKVSGKTCFWDNQDKNLTPDRKFRPALGEVVPISRFAGGADLMDNVGGVCTSCHAGQNPFIIHPGTPLGRPILSGLPLDPDQWYDPIVKPGWPENPGPNQSPLRTAGACDACHIASGTGGRFPQLSKTIAGYCDILDKAMQLTMPPSDPGSLYNDPHAVALRTQCAEAAPPDGDLARFVSQTPAPTSMPPGFTFSVSVTFLNAATTRWVGTHTLAIATPSGGGAAVWGTTTFPLGTTAQPVLPADEVTRAFTTLRAPMNPGTYDLAFVLRDPFGRVIGSTPQSQVVVRSSTTPFNNSVLSITSAPGTLPNGQGAIVTVSATNIGTTTWTSPGYSLRITRTGRVSVPTTSAGIPGGSVASLATVTFGFTITCNGQGLGSFTVQMAEPQTGTFGQSVGRNVSCQP